MAESPTTKGISRRLIWATVAVAAVAVAVLIGISASGGSDETSGEPGKVAFVDEVTALFAGIPQSGVTLGEPSAPVEILEYADLQCPFCAQAAATTVPELITRYVRTGKAKLTFRPLTFIGSDSERGALAAVAAGNQGKLWMFTELAYRNQGAENAGWLSERFVRDVGTALQLDLNRFDTDRAGSAAREQLTQAAALASADAVTATPTFIVVGPKGKVTIRNSSDLTEFQAAVSGLS